MLKEIRDEILTKLSELKPSTLKTVENYSGQFSDQLTDLVLRLPAALLHYEGSPFKVIAHQVYEVELNYQIWICSDLKRNSKRNVEQIEIAIDLIIKKLLELPDVEITEIIEAYYSEEVLIYAIRFKYEPKGAKP